MLNGAVDKMSKLGVAIPLSSPTECLPCEGEQDSTEKKDVIGEVAAKLVVEMGQAMAFDEAKHQEKNRKLEIERKESTTPVDIDRLDPIPELGTMDEKVEEHKPSN